MHPDLARHLRQRGALVLHSKPWLDEAARYSLRRRELVAVLPGVYVPSELAKDPWSLMRAIQARHPDAVMTGTSAEHALGWRNEVVPPVTAAIAYRVRDQPAFRFERRAIDPNGSASATACGSPTQP